MPSTPAFSVVVPTRDRPDFVRWCVGAVVAQTFGDVEVIVADNHTSASCRAEVDRIGDGRVRYVAPPSPLSMADNWRFATAQARGDYVSVITDKTVLMPSALEHAAAAIEGNHPDIVSWWSDGYDPLDEAAGIADGFYRPYFDVLKPTEYEPRSALIDSLRFAERQGHEGVRYYWGKLSFGVVSPRAAGSHRAGGRPRVLPDRTRLHVDGPRGFGSRRAAVDLGRPLQLTFNSKVSNGQRTAMHPAHARRFLHETDPTDAVLDAMPIPRLYTSVHNMVGHDYETSLRRLAGTEALGVDRVNRCGRAAEDLDAVHWPDPATEREQRAILDDWCRALGTEAEEQIVAARRRSRRRSSAVRARGGRGEVGCPRAPRTKARRCCGWRAGGWAVRCGAGHPGRDAPPARRSLRQARLAARHAGRRVRQVHWRGRGR